MDTRPAGEVVAQPARARASTSATATYPYPSSSMQDGRRLAQQLDDFSARQQELPHGRTRSILGSISLRHHRSRTNTVSRHEPTHTTGSSAHLAVPDSGAGRTDSIVSNGPAVVQNTPYAHQNGSAGTDGSSPLHANLTTTASPAQRPLQPQAARILCRLWLASAATFRRWGKMEECLGAINEAEDVAGDKDPEVWLQVSDGRSNSIHRLLTMAWLPSNSMRYI